MAKKGRPRIKLKLTKLDLGIELLGWLLLAGIWLLIITHFSELPETITIHYNAAGEADGFGNKWNILILPIIATVLLIGMTVLNRFPHDFNYAKNITEENAFQQYTQATRLIRFFKLSIVLLFGIIVFGTIQSATGNSYGFGVWFLPITLVVIFTPIIVYLIKSTR